MFWQIKIEILTAFHFPTMDQLEESKTKKPLTIEKTMELMRYASYWRPTLQKAAERGESIKDTYEELKDFEAMM